MGKLHSINKSPASSTALRTCLKSISEKSAIIFIEDGVYAALASFSCGINLSDNHPNMKYYALKPDIEARGLSLDKLNQQIEIIDYVGFVDLVADFDGLVAWS